MDESRTNVVSKYPPGGTSGIPQAAERSLRNTRDLLKKHPRKSHGDEACLVPLTEGLRGLRQRHVPGQVITFIRKSLFCNIGSRGNRTSGGPCR